MSWCVLDEESFSRCCRLLVQQSQRLRDGWSWEPGQVSSSALSQQHRPSRSARTCSALWTCCVSSGLSRRLPEEEHTEDSRPHLQAGAGAGGVPCSSRAAHCHREARGALTGAALPPLLHSSHPGGPQLTNILLVIFSMN